MSRPLCRATTALLLTLLCVFPQRAAAFVPSVLTSLPSLVLGNPPLPGDETIRARLKVCLLMGDLNCVVDKYLLLNDLGRAPGWLVAFQNAFSVANRKAGECERIARTIYDGLTKLGERPEFIRISVKGEPLLLGFDEVVNGLVIKSYQVAVTGQHIAVKLGDKVIDAYTGPAGLALSDYSTRLTTASSSHVMYTVVQSL